MSIPSLPAAAARLLLTQLFVVSMCDNIVLSSGQGSFRVSSPARYASTITSQERKVMMCIIAIGLEKPDKVRRPYECALTSGLSVPFLICSSPFERRAKPHSCKHTHTHKYTSEPRELADCVLLLLLCTRERKSFLHLESERASERVSTGREKRNERASKRLLLRE